jgi:hypothetical protein
MPSVQNSVHGLARHCSRWLIVASLCFTGTGAAFADTYYVAPTGPDQLSSSASAPGSLPFAAAHAPTGSRVILEDGVYDGAPNGFTVAVPSLILQAQHWHKAIVKNTVGSNLIGPSDDTVVTNGTYQGIVFGPSTGLNWSGGGGAGWKFLDCEFVDNAGMGAGPNALFEHDLFTDSKTNAFDLPSGVTVLNCIVRRSNRASADDDSVGNKEAFGFNMTFDGLVAYDNNGSALWFDTSNDGWIVKNCTFFANHGGNNWLNCDVDSGISATQFRGTGQDGQGLVVGQHMKGFAGTAANIGFETVITSVTGYNPQTFTVSPGLPATPANGDRFLVQQGNPSNGDAFTSEANDDGAFTDNVTYSNTGFGIYDHASGGTRYGGHGTVVVTNDLFAYDGQGFDYWPDGRDDGPATVEFNRFKFKPGSSLAFGSGGGPLGCYPNGMNVTFDYNVYDPDTNGGKWAAWYAGTPASIAGGLADSSQPAGQDFLQDPATWNQDQHSIVADVPFRSAPVASYVWPAGSDSNWGDVFYPNNKFALSGSIHQVDDTDGAVDNTIDAAIAGHQPGDIVFIPVSAHTPISDSTCEVYDLNGRWVKLTVKVPYQAAFLAAVPPYVTCVPGNKTTTYKIRVTLGSMDQYGLTATYSLNTGVAPAPPKLSTVNAGSGQATLVWTPVTGADTYSVYRGDIPVATGIKPASYTDGDLSNGKTYQYTVQAVNSYGTSSSSNALSVTPHDVTGALAGKSVAVFAASSARFVAEAGFKTGGSHSYDLTSLGTIDWRQWGDLGGTNSKASGGGQISDVTPFGGGKYGRWSGGFDVGWSDSVSNIANDDDQGFIWCNSAQNSGWTLTVPADTTTRTLSLFWGGAPSGSIRIDAHLSDGSAPDYTNANNPTGDTSVRLLETITYNSAKPGQTLTITLTKTDSNLASGTNPSVDLIAACLR